MDRDKTELIRTRQRVAEGGYHPPYICNLEDPQEPIMKIL